MRPLFTIAFALTTLLFFTGCRKDNMGSLNCEQIRTGLLTNHEELVEEAINRFTLSLRPDPASSDLYGHRLNIGKLVQMLNGDCHLSATAGCYNCIKTNPPQTEIFITINSGTTTVNKVIDLSYDRNKRLIFSNMHD
jgi:hypothetical protein